MSENKNRIPKRSEIPVEDTWALEDIFPTDEAWKQALEELRPATKALAEFKGKLSTDAGQLLAYMKFTDDLNRKLGRLYRYAGMRYDQDTSNTYYQDLSNRCMRLMTELDSADAFSSPEILSIPEETMEAFYQAEPELELYRRALSKMRILKDHVLTPREEEILAAAGEMGQSPETISGIFRNSDLKFPSVEDKEGVQHPLTSGSFATLLEDTDPDFRKRIFDTYYSRVGEFRNSFAAMMEAQVRQLKFFADMRGYKSSLEASLTPHEVPVSVYYNLVDSVRANLEPLHRYMSLRKKLLGGGPLHMQDVYVSIIPDAVSDIPIDEAKKTILEGLKPLGEDYLAAIKEGFDNRWIDVYENEGKRSGAYSNGSDPHPYVLMNYKNTLDSMFTLAHEMGHSLHSYLSEHHQPDRYKHYVIFVAEVASICNEMLLMYHLLGQETDKKQRAYLINNFLDQFRTTMYRQTQMAEFEMRINQAYADGESLTADMLCDLYLKINQEYYGPAMEEDPLIGLEWARVPHFYYDFYMFQYSTGFIAAASLARGILSEGEPAVKRYLNFLSSGCSKDPITLLKEAGVDMLSPQPIESAVALFNELLDEMEQLVF